MTEIQIFIHSLQIEWSLQQTSIKQKHILTGEAVARSENTTKSIFCGNFSSCGSPPVFLYRSLNGVENQSVLAGLNVNQVVERQPVFLGNTL